MNMIWNLVRMDFIKFKSLQKSQIFYMLLIVVLALIGPDFSLFSVVLLLYMMTYTIPAYDDMYKADYLTGTLPSSRSQIVLSKYIFNLFGIAIGVAFLVVENLLYTTPIYGNREFTILPIACLFVMMALLFLSISLPLVLILGATKSRIYVLVLYMAACAGALPLMRALRVDTGILENVMRYPVLLVGVGLALFAISYLFAQKFYQQKQFFD